MSQLFGAFRKQEYCPQTGFANLGCREKQLRIWSYVVDDLKDLSAFVITT